MHHCGLAVSKNKKRQCCMHYHSRKTFPFMNLMNSVALQNVRKNSKSYCKIIKKDKMFYRLDNILTVKYVLLQLNYC